MRKSPGKRDRASFQVVRRNDQRTILTLLGDVTLRSTSYRKKITREYRYLLDDQIGFRKKKRIDPLLEVLVPFTRKPGGTSSPETGNSSSVLRWRKDWSTT
jgi:hypothetical protein